MVESYVDHERSTLLSGGFKHAWSPPAVVITKTMRRDFALQKPLKDFYPMEVWHKYDPYSHIRDISSVLHFTFACSIVSVICYCACFLCDVMLTLSRCHWFDPLYLPSGINIKDLLQYGVPVVEFAQEPPLKPLRGLLVHATGVNCPPDCYRVSAAYLHPSVSTHSRHVLPSCSSTIHTP